MLSLMKKTDFETKFSLREFMHLILGCNIGLNKQKELAIVSSYTDTKRENHYKWRLSKTHTQTYFNYILTR